MVDCAVTACPSATTFDALVTCCLDSSHMPRDGSEGFVVPSDTDMDHWYNAARDMLEISASPSGSCGNVTLQGNLASLYEYVSLSDGTGDYCVLVEKVLVGDSKKSWGTFIVRLNPSRNLHFQVPHPIFDTNTGEQNAEIFQGTEARSLLLSGTHRNANAAFSSCQGRCNGDYKESDAAHNIKHMFQPTTRATKDWHESQGTEFVVLQLHGMSAISCLGTNFFITYGRPTRPQDGDCVDNLKNNLRNGLPGVITSPGDAACGDCKFNGGSNVQGRLLNGVDNNEVCGTGATTYTGRFIHIEQEPQYRDNASHIQEIINAIVSAFPTGSECSPEPPSSGGCSWATWMLEEIQGVSQRLIHYRHGY